MIFLSITRVIFVTRHQNDLTYHV